MNKGTIIRNGINYSGSSGGGQGGSGIDYSLEEQDTGLKWVNGRNVYQKTIEYKREIPRDTVTYVAPLDWNNIEIIDWYGVCDCNNTYSVPLIYYANATNYIRIAFTILGIAVFPASGGDPLSRLVLTYRYVKK